MSFPVSMHFSLLRFLHLIMCPVLSSAYAFALYKLVQCWQLYAVQCTHLVSFAYVHHG